MLALLVALSTALPASLAAAPGQAGTNLPVSLDRVRDGLGRPASPLLGIRLEVPIATFRTRVEQRVYVLTLEQWIDREFRLTALQRQSAAWGAKCCGFNLLPLGREVYRRVRKSLDERELRRAREEIARELAPTLPRPPSQCSRRTAGSAWPREPQQTEIDARPAAGP